MASLVKNALLFDMGLSYSYGVIAIPALTGADVTHNADEHLRITADQAALLGECCVMSLTCVISNCIALLQVVRCSSSKRLPACGREC